jgi:hypothetical protein
VLGLVVVDNFDLPGIFVPPFKADTPLVVDPDAPLALTVAAQLFEPVAGRFCKFFDPVDTGYLAKFAKGNPFD